MRPTGKTLTPSSGRFLHYVLRARLNRWTRPTRTKVKATANRLVASFDQSTILSSCQPGKNRVAIEKKKPNSSKSANELENETKLEESKGEKPKMRRYRRLQRSGKQWRRLELSAQLAPRRRRRRRRDLGRRPNSLKIASVNKHTHTNTHTKNSFIFGNVCIEPNG